jgi:hypothetical protein
LEGPHFDKNGKRWKAISKKGKAPPSVLGSFCMNILLTAIIYVNPELFRIKFSPWNKHTYDGIIICRDDPNQAFIPVTLPKESLCQELDLHGFFNFINAHQRKEVNING